MYMQNHSKKADTVSVPARRRLSRMASKFFVPVLP